jgi:hypothetical protein
MAQRGEGQGLQIAVISFAMLTIILAITTYVFYAQSASAAKDVEAKTKTLNDKNAENNKLMYRNAAMRLVLGLGGVTKEEVELAKSKAGGDDAEVKEILDNFTSDMALVGDQAAAGGTPSYRTFTTNLLAALNKKNASVADAVDQLKNMQVAKDKAALAEKARADTAVAASDNAVADYAKQTQAFADDRTKMEEQGKQLASRISTDAAKAKTEIQRVTDEKDLFVKQNTQVKDVNTRLKEQLDEIRTAQVNFTENPDGQITRVNQNQRLVWIDRGRADGLLRQTTFSVYDHNESGISDTKPKGRIEILTVGDRISEARILEDKPSNPIIPGDIIDTPAWSPGQRIHFALAMKMDVNKDRIDDYDMVKSIIQMNGGVIDAELRVDPTGKIIRNGDIGVETRYFVEGERPSDATSPDLMKQYTAFDQDRERFTVKKISVENLLALMGWRAEEKTVGLGGGRGGFMKRSPGKTQPATGTASPDEAPASESGATPAAPASDPFGAPAAPAPAAPAADPFGAPAAAPPAAKDADPFATP